MTILVTGGSGFLGSHVVEQLSREERPVRALVRTTSDTRFLRGLAGVELVEGAVDDAESLVRAAKGATAMVHAAGLVKARGPDEFNAVNAKGTANAVSAARANAGTVKRFVLVSSLAVSGPSEDGRALPLDAPPNPVTHYGRSKLGAERAVLAAKGDLAVTILRPPAIYGPRDREMLTFFAAINTGIIPYMGSANKLLSMIFGADAATACIRAVDADAPSGSIYYVDDGPPHTFDEMVNALERALGKRAWLRFSLPRGVIELAALGTELYGIARSRAVMLTRDKCNELFAPHWVCDSTLARRDLGWAPKTSFEVGVKITARWYRENGWL